MRLVVVEDNKTNLMILSCLAKQVEDCEVSAFSDPEMALASVMEVGCDLIMVDYLMPRLNGVEFIRAVRADAKSFDVPVVMITGEADRSVRRAAIDAGATDFLDKPIDPLELKTRLRNLLALRKAAIADRSRSKWLAREVARATKTIADREEEIIMRMVRAIALRDDATGAHVDRIAETSRLIGVRLGLGEKETQTLYLAAPMHDIGKLVVPDAILLKPGRLTDGERSLMECHTLRGHDILAGSQAPLLQKAAEIALSHHERMDGAGYPNGLKGRDIPLSARIVAVADVFDALISVRPYKRAWSVREAVQYLRDNRDKQFDADCVEAFLKDIDRAAIGAEAEYLALTA